MTQNPELYSEPERFNPDRFMQMSPEEAERKDPRNVVFGFGRRYALVGCGPLRMTECSAGSVPGRRLPTRACGSPVRMSSRLWTFPMPKTMLGRTSSLKEVSSPVSSGTLHCALTIPCHLTLTIFFQSSKGVYLCVQSTVGSHTQADRAHARNDCRCVACAPVDT